jgi:hypothetical protein
MTEKTLADRLREEEELLRARVVHHARPRRPMSLKEANDLCRRIAPRPKESLFQKSVGPN